MEKELKPTNESDLQLIDNFKQNLLSLNKIALKKLMTESKKMNNPIQFVEKVIVPVMEHIGTGWEQGRLALSQVYMSGRICEELVDTILPPSASERTDQPNMAICVLQDHHFLGKQIVYSMLRASGYELKDYGQVTIDDVVKRVKDDDIKILLISVLMLPSALMVKQVKEKLNAQNLEVKVVVGGAPFSFDRNLGNEVQADYVGYNAFDAVNIINKTMEEVS